MMGRAFLYIATKWGTHGDAFGEDITEEIMN